MPLFITAHASVPSALAPSNFRSLSDPAAPDPLVEFIVPAFATVLITISNVYVDKMKRDLANVRSMYRILAIATSNVKFLCIPALHVSPPQEALLLGGHNGPRAPLELVLYDFFLARFGVRQATEMHLAAFLKAVQRYK